MGRKGHEAEQIIGKLREAEAELARGKTTGEVCRQLGGSEQTYYRWRKEYGGLRVDQARRLRELEQENARLKELVMGQVRSMQRRAGYVRSDEAALVGRMVELASEYGRYGYRRIAILLRREGFRVNHKRVERLWRREGLKVPARQPKRGRLRLNDGSCVRL